MFNTRNKINNNGNSLNKNNYEILLLSEKTKLDTKDKKKQNRNKSLPNNLFINSQIQSKLEKHNKTNLNKSKYKENKNSSINKIIFNKDEEFKNEFDLNEKINLLRNNKHKTYYFRNNKNFFNEEEIFYKKIKNTNNINNKESKYKNKEYFYSNTNKYNKLLFKAPNIPNEKYFRNKDRNRSNFFANKSKNLIKKYEIIGNNKCVMPANDLSNILIGNEKEFLFNTNFLSKLC